MVVPIAHDASQPISDRTRCQRYIVSGGGRTGTPVTTRASSSDIIGFASAAASPCDGAMGVAGPRCDGDADVVEIEVELEAEIEAEIISLESIRQLLVAWGSGVRLEEEPLPRDAHKTGMAGRWERRLQRA